MQFQTFGFMKAKYFSIFYFIQRARHTLVSKIFFYILLHTKSKEYLSYQPFSFIKRFIVLLLKYIECYENIYNIYKRTYLFMYAPNHEKKVNTPCCIQYK